MPPIFKKNLYANFKSRINRSTFVLIGRRSWQNDLNAVQGGILGRRAAGKPIYVFTVMILMAWLLLLILMLLLLLFMLLLHRQMMMTFDLVNKETDINVKKKLCFSDLHLNLLNMFLKSFLLAISQNFL